MLKLVPKYQKGKVLPIPQQGGSFTTGALANIIWEFPNQVKYGNGNYYNVNNKLLSQLTPNSRGHYLDNVKLSNHPTHPSRGKFN